MTTAPEFIASEAGTLLSLLGFAPMERVVSAVMQLCADEKLHGRAAGIFPLSNEDLGDDLEGAYSGMVLQKPDLPTIKPNKPSPSAWLEACFRVMRLGLLGLTSFFSVAWIEA
jgi:hypothetical protein